MGGGYFEPVAALNVMCPVREVDQSAPDGVQELDARICLVGAKTAGNHRSDALSVLMANCPLDVGTDVAAALHTLALFRAVVGAVCLVVGDHRFPSEWPVAGWQPDRNQPLAVVAQRRSDLPRPLLTRDRHDKFINQRLCEWHEAEGAGLIDIVREARGDA
jgi:hypothetical protein